jgi:hypothetical protein
MNQQILPFLKDVIILGVVPLMLGWFKYQQFKNTKKINDTHTLVNSAMGTQLLLTWTALKRYADLSEDPQDISLANEAKKAYDSHVAKQLIVDSGNKSP